MIRFEAGVPLGNYFDLLTDFSYRLKAQGQTAITTSPTTRAALWQTVPDKRRDHGSTSGVRAGRGANESRPAVSNM